MTRVFAGFLGLLVACSGDKDSGGVGDGGGGSGGGDDSAADDSGGETGLSLPDDPTPFTLTVEGDYDDALVFDSPTCSWFDGAPSFRAFWRNAAAEHVFVLVADIQGAFTEAGTYDQSMGTVRVKLQEEAGGAGYYFATDTAQGDTATITVEHVDETSAWGEFEFSMLHATDGAYVTASPQPVPIWCPTMN